MSKSKASSPISAAAKHKKKLEQDYIDSIEKTKKQMLEKFGVKLTFWPEHNFAGKWRFDFYCPELNLAIEFDGFGHHKYANFLSDMEKFNTSTLMGYTVLHFIPSDVNFVATRVAAYYIRRSKRFKGKVECLHVDRLDAKMGFKI